MCTKGVRVARWERVQKVHAWLIGNAVEVHHVPLMTPLLFWPFTIILSFFILFHSFSIHPEFITKESRVGAEFSFVRILNFEIASGRANTQKE